MHIWGHNPWRYEAKWVPGPPCLPSLCCPSGGEPRNEKSPRQCSPVRRSAGVITRWEPQTQQEPCCQGDAEGGGPDRREVQGHAGQTLSAQETPVGLYRQEAPRSPSARKGRSSVLHSLSRALSPWQTLAPRTQKSSLEGWLGRCQSPWWARRWMDGGDAANFNKIALEDLCLPCPLRAAALSSSLQAGASLRSRTPASPAENQSQEVLPK